MPATTNATWITWTGTIAHAVIGRCNPNDVRNGSFPVACGRWAPDPMDGGRTPSMASGEKRCKRCAMRV